MFETFYFSIFCFLIVTVLVLSGTSQLCTQLQSILNGGKRMVPMKQQNQQGIFKQVQVNSDSNKPQKTSTDLVDIEMEVHRAECFALDSSLAPFLGQSAAALFLCILLCRLKEAYRLFTLTLSCLRMQILQVIYFQIKLFLSEGQVIHVKIQYVLLRHKFTDQCCK